ncbi:MAG: VWA domain-containing protein [Myxococcales bacterium]|nr:VWA domain-containing protein [Myxococcales bacterium]
MRKTPRSNLLVTSLLAPALVAGALAVTLAGCPDREVAKVDPRQNREQKKEVPVQTNRNIDILFVIDNSGSMKEEQASLVTNFQNFINVLDGIDGGLPDVHIGVVSTNVGAGLYDGIAGCEIDGDNGLLQNGDDACEAPNDRYIEDLVNDDGSRNRNYDGENLAATFSCIAELGITGCGFEQPLESMRRALNGSNPLNDGFLRPDAFLAVIIISDEDDCSVQEDGGGMFNPDSALDNIDSSLGFLNSFRCFEFGVQCEPDENPRSTGPRADCVPRADSAYMYDVDEYANFLKSLKDEPGQIIVAGIIGPPTPVIVGLDSGEPALNPSCGIDDGNGQVADPAVRINAFLSAFPNRNTSTTICNDDLSDALTVIAELLKEVIGQPCMEGYLTLDEGEPDCSVTDVRYLNQDGQEESIIPKCNVGLDNLPCFHFVEDTETCSIDLYPTQLTLVIERATSEVPSNTTVVARCVGCVVEEIDEDDDGTPDGRDTDCDGDIDEPLM